MLEERLRDSEFRTEHERLYADMLEHLAPATEGPIVKPGRKRCGRLIFGDSLAEACGRPRPRPSIEKMHLRLVCYRGRGITLAASG